MLSNQQLTLSVQLRDEATFHNFFPARNKELLDHLQSMVHAPTHEFCYLWGGAGVGKSHLLQACCLAVLEQERGATYLSLAEPGLRPDILDGLEHFSFVCLDDLHQVIGDPSWQEGLFHFYNRLRDQSSRLIVAATTSLKQLNCSLADLQSRLSWGAVYQVHGLSDAEKLQALQLRAKQRGLRLPAEVGAFLLKRCARDMTSLYQILEQLDQASLSMQRSITIPFVKEVLAV